MSAGEVEGLYLLRDTFEVFEPGEIDVFPVVRADYSPGEQDCTIYVGIADDQLVWASASSIFGDQSACTIARQMAAYTIANLPPPH